MEQNFYEIICLLNNSEHVRTLWNGPLLLRKNLQIKNKIATIFLKSICFGIDIDKSRRILRSIRSHIS
jgi:hypothetical protein